MKTKNIARKGMLPLFDAGYINLSRQYLTIGVNGWWKQPL